MRRFLISLVIILSSPCFSYDEYLLSVQGGLTFTTPEYYLTNFSFSKGFIYGVDKTQHEFPIGTVEILSEWTRAYVFKVGDTIIATHRARLLSPGSLLDCLKMYEVYNENNQLEGFIEGEWNGNAAASFFFYNENYECFAKASLDLSASMLTIRTPDDQILITGKKNLRAVWHGENYYYWKIKKEQDSPHLSGSFLWPFMAFLSEVWWR